MIDLKDYVRMIEEGQGVYDGCEELAKYIVEIIKSNPNEDFFIISGDDLKFKNIFFKNLLIYIENLSVKEDAAYHVKTKDESKVLEYCKNIVKWDIKDKIFNFIEISVDRNNINHYDIGHELNHSYEDYEIHKNDPNKDILSYIDPEAYGRAKTFYTKGNPMQKVVGYIIYVSTGTELRAFTTQALIKFKENLDKYNNFDDALIWQKKNNKVFKEYIENKESFEHYIENKTYKEVIARIYKQILDTDKNIKNDKLKNRNKFSNLKTNEIIEKLSNNLLKFEHSLTKHINIILKDYAKKFSI